MVRDLGEQVPRVGPSIPICGRILDNSENNLYVRITHTIYTRNNMGLKCEGNCGLWVLNKILKKSYPENLKKIVGVV